MLLLCGITPRYRKIRVTVSGFVDYYKLLGISANATQREVRVAYVRAAKEHHPDKGGSHEHMQRLNLAYATLVDDTKRSAYDRMYRMEAAGAPDAYRVAGEQQANTTDMSDDEIDDFLNSVYAEFVNQPPKPPLHKKVASAVRDQLKKRKAKGGEQA